ncbi:MAG TPA: nicotinate (nicotinamide) nucleotide adenylyltransferase [Terriglobales bacterium]|nr:nicotinate (nicotinamide) nucleotide adenylyltransferase [Terriglobales bacterium]
MKPPLAKAGVLGGTFDPVHAGHLAMAQAAARACGLERIYFVPAPNPWHRPAPSASYPDRFAMLALALARHPRWMPLAVPDHPRRPTYALDQVDWIERWLTAQGRRERLHWILGADAFLTLPTWRHYRQLLRRCDFVVLARAGIPLEQVLATLPRSALVRVEAQRVQLAGGGQLHWLGRFSSPASSTRLRARPAGAQAAHLLPTAVLHYARRAGLYGYGQSL